MNGRLKTVSQVTETINRAIVAREPMKVLIASASKQAGRAWQVEFNRQRKALPSSDRAKVDAMLSLSFDYGEGGLKGVPVDMVTLDSYLPGEA